MSVPFPSQQQLDRGSVMRADRRAAVQAARNGELIEVDRPALCDACGHPIEPGSNAWWAPRQGAVHDHPDCLAGLGIDEYRPAPLPDREPGHYQQEHDEYVLGRLTDADDKREAGL